MLPITPKTIGMSLGVIRALGNLVPSQLSAGTTFKLEDIEIGKAAQGKPDNHPDNVYATVKVNGQVVATLYNSGASVTGNADYAKLKNLPSMSESETLTGPQLAQKRANEIAKALGGKVEIASTAQTSSEWQTSKTQSFNYSELLSVNYSGKEKSFNMQSVSNAYKAKVHYSNKGVSGQLNVSI